MSGVEWRLVTPVFSTGTGGKKTLLQIVAPANQRVWVGRIDLSLAGTSVTDSHPPVRILRQTTAGTSTALAATKGNNGDNETLQVTAGYNHTAEPTAGDELDGLTQHPQNARRYGPFWVPGGTRLGIEVDMTGLPAVNCKVSSSGEE